MNPEYISLDQLSIGSSALIHLYLDKDLRLACLPMGMVPTEMVTMIHISAWGDPFIIEVSGHRLAIRKQDAEQIILVKPSNNATLSR